MFITASKAKQSHMFITASKVKQSHTLVIASKAKQSHIKKCIFSYEIATPLRSPAMTPVRMRSTLFARNNIFYKEYTLLNHLMLGQTR